MQFHNTVRLVVTVTYRGFMVHLKHAWTTNLKTYCRLCKLSKQFCSIVEPFHSDSSLNGTVYLYFAACTLPTNLQTAICYYRGLRESFKNQNLKVTHGLSCLTFDFDLRL